LNADVECLSWNPQDSKQLLVTQENGEVICFDALKPGGEAVWRLPQAHSKAVSGLSVHPSIPGLFATASVDRSVKFWDMSQPNEPLCVLAIPFKKEKVFCLSFFDDEKKLLAVGTKSDLRVLKLNEHSALREHFKLH